MDFEFQVEFYVVSMAYNPEYTPWSALIIDSVCGAVGLGGGCPPSLAEAEFGVAVRCVATKIDTARAPADCSSA